ncbi:(R)-mandelonitrile lyase [Syntrophotalea acetylenica]|uniref:Carboxymuconolactone decarboxylase n=1 Tax=Syntrophotalea acetylenica TaxID=29542 RepID=A0A1L3GDE6_SYNAC|nr:carboxymuconolactone decarboxylase family protein [Syntrophotalea acetylenica]APG23970.1 carboxymuconolactone decarboxylase [Syntrophotalea acetylenica]APG44552.1 carboxymuconolactone decarboxylase [Syntrophotalea acetylenica]
MKKYAKTITTLMVVLVSIVSFSQAQADENKTLTTKEKGIIPIAAFTATGNLPQLETALAEGLNAGLTINEIKEILVHSYAYAGFPRALNGINTFMAVLDQRREQGISDTPGKEASPLPADFDRNAYGHQVRNALVGRDISNRTSGYAVFTPVIDQFLVEHLFAEIFVRDVLTHQERQLVTISILAAKTGTEPQLRSHFGVSMNVGWSKSQLADFIQVLEQKVNVETAQRAADTLNDFLGINLPESRNPSVKVIKNQAPTKGSEDYFTGNVTVESRFSSETPDSYRGGIVNFEPRARTAWHTHPFGQTLIVISGRGLVQSEGDAIQEILPGDVVWIPANERHWHGATPDSPMSHVAISDPMNGSTVEWMEHVRDEQYASRSSFKNEEEKP